MALREAILIERAGGRWCERHAAAVTQCSAAFLRISDCPKERHRGHGAKKPMLFYHPHEVRIWMDRRTERARLREPRA